VPEGFEVNSGQVAAAGRNVCELADTLRAARSSWDGATRDGGRACGMDVAEKAYTAMQDAWFAEVGVHITILEQACGALGATADGYTATDRLGGNSRVQ
jgi:hypothetical protein